MILLHQGTCLQGKFKELACVLVSTTEVDNCLLDSNSKEQAPIGLAAKVLAVAGGSTIGAAGPNRAIETAGDDRRRAAACAGTSGAL